MSVETVLARVLNDVTEEGEAAAAYWAPEVIRLLKQRGYLIVRDYSPSPVSDVMPLTRMIGRPQLCKAGCDRDAPSANSTPISSGLALDDDVEG